MLKPQPHCYSIWRWDFGAVIGSIGGALVWWELCPFQKRHLRACFSFLHAHVLRKCLVGTRQGGGPVCKPGRDLTRNPSCSTPTPDLPSPELRKHISAVSATLSMVFCYGSPSWLIYYVSCKMHWPSPKKIWVRKTNEVLSNQEHSTVIPGQVLYKTSSKEWDTSEGLMTSPGLLWGSGVISGKTPAPSLLVNWESCVVMYYYYF